MRNRDDLRGGEWMTAQSPPNQAARCLRQRPWDQVGTTRYARSRTTCASTNALPLRRLLPDIGDLGKRVTTIYWRSSGSDPATEHRGKAGRGPMCQPLHDLAQRNRWRLYTHAR